MSHSRAQPRIAFTKTVVVFKIYVSFCEKTPGLVLDAYLMVHGSCLMDHGSCVAKKKGARERGSWLVGAARFSWW